MKVLHVFKTWYPDTLGGIERVIYEICDGFAKNHNVQSYVLTTAVNSKAEFQSGSNPCITRVQRIVHNDSTPVPDPFVFRDEYLRLLSQVDIVHYHFPWPISDIYDLMLNRRSKIPVVITYQSDIVRQKYLLFAYKFVLYKFLSKANAIVATSENYLRSSKILQRYAEKVSVIPNGLADVPVSIRIRSMCKEYAEKYGEDYFIFVGAPRYYKGLDILVQASKDAPYKVLIAGDGKDVNEIKQYVSTNGLENVIFLGAVNESQKYALILGSLALVLPSTKRSEAYGLALIEASILSKPMISTYLGTGTSWINKNQETGLVVRPNCPDSLKNAMSTLYYNKDNAGKFGQNARYRYEKLLTSDKMIGSYANLYKKLLGNSVGEI